MFGGEPDAAPLCLGRLLASVLNSPIAIQASIEVVRAFVRFRHLRGDSSFDGNAPRSVNAFGKWLEYFSKLSSSKLKYGVRRKSVRGIDITRRPRISRIRLSTRRSGSTTPSP